MFKELIARILGIDTYLDIALELQRENTKLNEAIFKAYEKGKEAAYTEILENTNIEEIEIEDLIDLEEEYEIN